VELNERMCAEDRVQVLHLDLRYDRCRLRLDTNPRPSGAYPCQRCELFVAPVKVVTMSLDPSLLLTRHVRLTVEDADISPTAIQFIVAEKGMMLVLCRELGFSWTSVGR
jgi:hypothetical protein